MKNEEAIELEAAIEQDRSNDLINDWTASESQLSAHPQALLAAYQHWARRYAQSHSPSFCSAG